MHVWFSQIDVVCSFQRFNVVYEVIDLRYLCLCLILKDLFFLEFWYRGIQTLHFIMESCIELLIIELYLQL